MQKLNKYLVALPQRLDKEISLTSQQFMKDVRKSAKLRAPVDTGTLKESINLLKTRTTGKTKQWKIKVDALHAIFQEEGFTPHRFFADQPFNSSKLPPGKSYFVSKFTPFMKPALEANIGKLEGRLNDAMERAIK